VAGRIELGKKHECESCGTKYYDFGKPDPACPKCGAPSGGMPPEEEAKAPASTANSKRKKKADTSKKNEEE
jgi:hypothetical protein